MSIVVLVLVSIFLFSLITLLRKWADSFVLIAFAIGCAVNANLYTSATCPVHVGGMVFSIDSILFTIFMYCVAVKSLHYSKKDTWIFVYSSIVAIILSAFIEFFAHLSSPGESYTWSLLFNIFLKYIISAAAALLGIWLMLMFIHKMEEKHVNRYISISIGILIASIVNSTVYYSFLLIDNYTIEEILPMLLGSYIGKTYSIALALHGYWINIRYWIPNELKQQK